MDSFIKENIHIEKGIGPLKGKKGGINIGVLPLTVFIGPQGAGKSLISQFLYFFRNAEYLIAQYSEHRDHQAAIRPVMEGIRGGGFAKRTLVSFPHDDSSQINYEFEYKKNKETTRIGRNVTISRKQRNIRAGSPFSEEVSEWFQKWFANISASGQVAPKAIFAPAERILFSQFIGTDPAIFGQDSFPLTMREFAKILGKIEDMHQFWEEEKLKKPQEIKIIDSLMTEALNGKAVPSRRTRFVRNWQWKIKNTNRHIEIGMASSGQMNTWPLVFIAQGLMGWKKETSPIFLHIEEPEAHLHPAAQVAMAKLMAFLVNHGVHVVITTHSLTILYALNNLTLAYNKLGEKHSERVTEVPFRMPPSCLAAYLFTDDGEVKDIVDKESGQLDESLLGNVLGDLEVEYNQIMAYKILWE